MTQAHTHTHTHTHIHVSAGLGRFPSTWEYIRQWTPPPVHRTHSYTHTHTLKHRALERERARERDLLWGNKDKIN